MSDPTSRINGFRFEVKNQSAAVRPARFYTYIQVHIIHVFSAICQRNRETRTCNSIMPSISYCARYTLTFHTNSVYRRPIRFPNESKKENYVAKLKRIKYLQFCS